MLISLTLANVAAKNKIRKRGQVAPALRASNNRLSKDTQITNMGNDGSRSSVLVKQQIEGEEEVKGISIQKSNHLCAPENTCKSPRKRRLSEMSRHSLSERVMCHHIIENVCCKIEFDSCCYYQRDLFYSDLLFGSDDFMF